MGSVKLRLKESKTRKDGEAPIVVQIVHNRKSTEVGTGRSVHPRFWNFEKRIVTPKHPSSAALNAYIKNVKSGFETKMDKLLATGVEFTLQDITSSEEVKQAHNPRIVDYLDAYITDNPEGLEFNTMPVYSSALGALKEFNPDLTFSDLTEVVLQAFERFLREKKGISVNTIHNRMKVLRKICNTAKRAGLMDHYPFENFKLKKQTSQRSYLHLKEIQSFMKVNVETPLEELIKDAFLFCCFTGLRFSDLCLLTKENVLLGPKGSRLSFHIAKTKEPLNLPLPEYAVRIMNKWSSHAKSNFLFPILSGNNKGDNLKKEISSRNASFNKILKDLDVRAEVNKSVSFHVARHTFATLMLSRGVSMEVVGKLLGHEDLKTTQVYAKVVDRVKDEAISRLDDIVEENARVRTASRD